MKHVIHPAPAAVHRDSDADDGQRAGEGGAGELAVLVDVEDLGPAEGSYAGKWVMTA